MMADSIIKRGNSFVSSIIKNHTEMEASLSMDKQNMENLAESSKRLSKFTDSTMSEYYQFVKNDLLKQLTRTEIEGIFFRISPSVL